MLSAREVRTGLKFSACLAVGIVAVAAAAAPADHAINTKGTGASGRSTGTFTISGVADEHESIRYYRVTSTGDLDGDGLPDDAVLKVECAAGGAAHVLVSPRDSGSGMATGKRMHKPVTFVKEWSPASPQLRAAAVGYDVKTAKGARTAAGGGEWIAVDLASGSGVLCSR
jgi:hypothetical protein